MVWPPSGPEERFIKNSSYMKRFLLLLVCLVGTLWSVAEVTVNLTPLPKSMKEGTGELVLPEAFVIDDSALPDSMTAEVQLFIEALSYATGYSISEGTADPLITITQNSDLAQEGYNLTVTTESVTLEAATTAGLYFGLQTIKKILPANVMAGVQDESVTEYALPVVTIKDEPRFSYRGFMLDVSRHFFTVDEVKRMLDVMSYYKMNKFHWHLTDDQGWRIEIKKYPKLTSIASIAPNSRFTDMVYGQYWINKEYGPYYYTQEELKEVVAYAAERHIDVIPEIDMPGHFVAALCAYPEYSCTPNDARTVWIEGGVSSDVLNVANDKAVQFIKDILDELMEIFPYEMIHIGGDECPTTYWAANDECVALYEEEGYSSYRELQCRFIKQLSDYVGEQGRKIALWNEAITADGTDTDVIQETGATIFCWTGAVAAAKSAASLGLNNVYTRQPIYYINRKQSTLDTEPAGAGTGSDSVQAVYEEEACPSSISSSLTPYYTGVQGTFWTEHVSDRIYMEYLALPRLMAIAEAGWTQRADKDYDSFRERMRADTVLLNYGHYNYGRHIMGNPADDQLTLPEATTEGDTVLYRVVASQTTGTRVDRCWELVGSESSLLTTWSEKDIAENRLWTNTQADEADDNYDYQMWFLEEDPDNEGYYALVCNALPGGSINPTPTAQSTSGRWDYDESTKNYNFVLGEYAFGVDGDDYYYTVNSTEAEGYYMFCSTASQGYAVNLTTNPSSGSAGYWTFERITPVYSLDLIDEVQEFLNATRTYDGDPELGAYDASLKAAVQELLDTNLTGMDDEALSDLSDQINTALAEMKASFGYLEEGGVYCFTNGLEEYADERIFDDGECDYMLHTSDVWSDDAWTVTSSTINDDYTQTVALQNTATGRYFGAAESSVVTEVGYPMDIATSATDIVIEFNNVFDDYDVSSSELNLFPIPSGSSVLPCIVSAGSSLDYNAERPVGGTWKITEVKVIDYTCTDDEGNDLGSYTRSLPVATEDLASYCPEITNYELKSTSIDGTTVAAVYERVSYSVTTFSTDSYGAWIEKKVDTVAVGESYTVSLPEPDYFTLKSSTYDDGTVITPTEDLTITAVFTTDAYSGVKAVAEAVSTISADHSYLIYDNSSANDGGRKGYRSVIAESLEINRVLIAEGATPYTTWTLESNGTVGYQVKNEYVGQYVPLMSKGSTAESLSTSAGTYTFEQNDDGSWCITGTNSVCWDGIAAGGLVGWTSPGHPYIVFDYYVEPYYEITINSIVEETDSLLGTETDLAIAGSTYSPWAETYDGYELKSIESESDLDAVGEHLTVNLVYTAATTGISSVVASAEEGKQEGIYDLTGRRLNGIRQPGIYIIDSKKVLVK